MVKPRLVGIIEDRCNYDLLNQENVECVKSIVVKMSVCQCEIS